MPLDSSLDPLPAIPPGVALLRALERGGTVLDAVPEWELSTLSWQLFAWAQEVRDRGAGSERERLYRVLADDPGLGLAIVGGRVRVRELG
jgi:hypothetical protein